MSTANGSCAGTVVSFGNTFGWIDGDDGHRVFVHFSGISGRGFKRLVAGQRVTYGVTIVPRGPCAVDVTVIPVVAQRPSEKHARISSNISP